MRVDFRFEEALCRPDRNRRCYKVVIPAEKDLSSLLPYLNAVCKVVYYDPEEQVLMYAIAGHKVVVRPYEVGISEVADFEEGRRLRDEVATFLEEIWSRRGEINPRHEPRKRPPALEIYKLLPKTNCGQCREKTCLAFAMKISVAEAALDDCPPLKTSEFAPQLKELNRLLGE